VSGSDIPDAVENFQVLSSSYSLPPYILKNVVAMGYSEPTPIQMQAIPLMLQVPPKTKSLFNSTAFALMTSTVVVLLFVG